MKRYCELKEMTIQEWAGEPFDAYVVNEEGTVILDPCIRNITGFNSAGTFRWITSNGATYLHVYPVSWNKDRVERALEPEPAQKRMTNRQLAQWLAQGNGMKTYADARTLDIDPTCCVYTDHAYDMGHGSNECNDRIRVQKWDSEEWVVPTTDLLQTGR